MKLKNITKIISEPGKQELIILREFNAPRALVFRAFTEPDLLAQFFAPFGNTMHFNYHEYRSGGRYSWCNKDPSGNTLCTFAGTIHELTAPLRIIQTSEFMEIPERGHVVMEAINFEELEGDRTRIDGGCVVVVDARRRRRRQRSTGRIGRCQR